ncbi:unnamed protein product [Leuciscus chuanchicus]
MPRAAIVAGTFFEAFILRNTSKRVSHRTFIRADRRSVSVEKPDLQTPLSNTEDEETFNFCGRKDICVGFNVNSEFREKVRITRHGSCSTASVDKLDLLPLLAQSLTEKLNLTWQRVRKLFLLNSFPQNNALLIKEANNQTALVLSNITLEHNPDTEKVNASQSTRAEGCALQSDNGKDRRLASSSITRETLTSFTFWPDHYKHHLMNTREM